MTESAANRTLALQLYENLLNAWNRRNAADFADLFGESGSCVGFDGSEMSGQAEIANNLGAIFGSHVTPRYIAKVREVRSLGETVMLVRAVAGMVPPGESEINSDLNAIQNLVVVNDGNGAQVALFQNTPAAFHGRPELRESLTEELSEAARAGLVVEVG